MTDKTALISDIHGNSPALRAVLKEIAAARCNRIFVLGDIINGIDPRGCVELIRALPNVVCLKGNAEYYTLTPDLALYPRRNEPFFAALIEILQWYRDCLSETDLAWLRQLPDHLLWNNTCLVHDHPFDRFFPQDRYQPEFTPQYQELSYHSKGIFPDISTNELDELLEWMDLQKLSVLFCGHTHIPFYKKSGTRVICNAGSAGLPLDGDPRPSWVLLEENEMEGFSITIYRVSYDIGESLALIEQTPDYPDFSRTGMREAYIKMLQTGVHWSVHLQQEP